LKANNPLFLSGFFSGFLLLLFATTPALLHAGTRDPFFAIPSAGILPHGGYQLQSRLAWSPDIGPDEEAQFPYVTGVRFGLFDRGEFGVDYGQDLSLSGKMQFVQEGILLPAFSFGSRQVFGSQEAWLFSIPDSQTIKWENELYMSALKKISQSGTEFHGGVSVIAGLDSGRASVFWGINQDIGKGFSVAYEGYTRDDLIHQNLGFAWNWDDMFRISAGLREFTSWFYQDGKTGFFTGPEQTPVSDAREVPGAWLKISLTGWIAQNEAVGLEGRLKQLEETNKNLAKRQEQHAARLDRTETQLLASSDNTQDSILMAEEKATEYLDRMVREFESEAYDVALVRSLQDSLLTLGESAHRVLTRMVRSGFVSDRHKEQAIRIMAFSKNERYIPVLIEQLTAIDNNAQGNVQREILLALGKFNATQAIPAIRPLLDSPDSATRKTAKDIITQLENPPAE